MLQEVSTAVLFIASILKRAQLVQKQSLEQFITQLSRDLQFRFQDHWFPHSPERGTAFRCIRNSTRGGIDPRILKAGSDAGISMEALVAAMPSEFLLWVDPREVSYRIGEFGCITKLARSDIYTLCQAFHDAQSEDTKTNHNDHSGFNIAAFDYTATEPDFGSPGTLYPMGGVNYSGYNQVNTVTTPGIPEFVPGAHWQNGGYAAYTGCNDFQNALPDNACYVVN